MPIFGPKCQFWAKFGRFWAQNPIFWGQGVKILVPSYRDSNETPFLCWKHWLVRLQLAARGENVLFWPKNLDIWGQKSIFCIVIAIFVNGAYNHYTRGNSFPIRTTPKKNSVSEQWVIFRDSPQFLALLGLCQFTSISTLNFGQFSTKLGGNVRAIKEMTQNDNRPSPGRNDGKTAVFTFSWKVFFWPNKHPKFLERLIFIWENAAFFFEQLSFMARTL